MPRNHRKSKRGGGFSDTLNSLTQSASQGLNSLSQGATNVWNSTKKSISGSSTPSSTPYYSSTPSYKTGGKSRRRRMRGGFKDNISMTNLASKSASFYGGKTAQPHNWVGGKRRTRKHKKSRKSRRH